MPEIAYEEDDVVVTDSPVPVLDENLVHFLDVVERAVTVVDDVVVVEMQIRDEIPGHLVVLGFESTEAFRLCGNRYHDFPPQVSALKVRVNNGPIY